MRHVDSADNDRVDDVTEVEAAAETSDASRRERRS